MAAKDCIARAGLTNVAFQQADIFDLPFAAASFDQVFACFVLEHLRDPLAALARLKLVLKPGGTITAIEGDHGSTYFFRTAKTPGARYGAWSTFKPRSGETR